jgi:hypothetical protein
MTSVAQDIAARKKGGLWITAVGVGKTQTVFAIFFLHLYVFKL